MLALLVALLLQSAYPTPPPSPAIFVLATLQDPPPRHDKYRDDPQAACVKPEIAAYYHRPSLHACTCKLMCVDHYDSDGTKYSDQGENQECEMYCTKERCACHPEEPCDAPDVEPPPK